mmetsp:Transcript_22066/g.57571  ORF Transcript_22066/g.57571 Transcript_22066/m.57571 type:complete len:416 (-) Transcript_22066:248-1495(-)
MNSFKVAAAVATVAASVPAVLGHGHVTLPTSTRNGGLLATGGSCVKGQCFWFSNNVEIPGTPTLPNQHRSVQINVTGQPEDVYAHAPWRAPGTAPVFGSGCGAAGGGPMYYENGGMPPAGVKQGLDGLELPPHGEPAQWKRGDEVTVAWAISANHGGGYSWRLCKNTPGGVNEECFQRTQLDFTSNTSFLVYPEQTAKAVAPAEVEKVGGTSCTAVSGKAACGTTYNNSCLKCGTASSFDCLECCPGCAMQTKGEYQWCTCGSKPPAPPAPPTPPPGPPQPFANAIISEGTFPTGSQWKRDPIPGCYLCDAYKTCGAPIPAPKEGQPQTQWEAQVQCYASCDGTTATGSCPLGTTQFPEPLPGISGFGKVIWPWSIADTVRVPTNIEPGNYLLSWRWDCEESTQVWQNCADITIA